MHFNDSYITCEILRSSESSDEGIEFLSIILQ